MLTLPIRTSRARALSRGAPEEQIPGQALPVPHFTHRWSGSGSYISGREPMMKNTDLVLGSPSHTYITK